MGNKTEITRHYIGPGNSHYWPMTQNSAPYPVSDFIQAVYGVTRTAADNPKYKSLIEAGVNATNNMVVTAQEFSFSRPSLEVGWCNKARQAWRCGTTVSTKMLNFQYGVSPHTLRPGTLFMSDVDNKALIGIIKKIRKHETSDFSGPTFAGELRETLSMIRSPLKALRLKTGLFTDLHMRILRDKQARGRKAEQSWSHVISDTWLEWTFGAAPLINDIRAILEMFLNEKSSRFHKGLQRLSYRFVDDYNDTQYTGAENIWTGTSVRYKFNRVRHFQGGVQYVVWIDNSLIFHGESQIERVLDLSNIRLDEIIPTAWELLPWSFLIDYFTNIGDVLGSTFNFNRNVAFGNRTVYERCVVYDVPLKAYVTSPSDEYLISAEPWTYTSSYKRIERGQYNVLKLPQLRVSLPSVGQANNIAALFNSLQNRNPFKGHTLK